MSLFKDFKRFALKGNVIDLSVGVVIGGAFGKIISSLVSDIVMPFISLLLPKGDWRKAEFVLLSAKGNVQEVGLKYGNFLGSVLDFLIVAFALFLVVSKLMKMAEAKFSRSGPETRECPFCLETISSRAKRCKFCTSVLEAPAPPAP